MSLFALFFVDFCYLSQLDIALAHEDGWLVMLDSAREPWIEKRGEQRDPCKEDEGIEQVPISKVPGGIPSQIQVNGKIKISLGPAPS